MHRHTAFNGDGARPPVRCSHSVPWPTAGDHLPVPWFELLGDAFAALVELSATPRTDDVFAPDFRADSAFDVRAALGQVQ